MQLTRHELNGNAEFVDDSSFRLNSFVRFPATSRWVSTNSRAAPVKRTSIALPIRWRRRCGASQEPRLAAGGSPASTTAPTMGKISLLNPFVGKSGWLTLSLFTVESLDQAEDHLIFAAITDGLHAGRRSGAAPAHAFR